MNRTDETTEKLMHIAEAVCSGAGYELVDLRFVREQGGWVLRVFIDRMEGRPDGIGFEDCERVSRELGAVLDVEDLIAQAYRLEVSSPGVDRPLRTADHFRRFTGRTARVTLREGLGGRRNFKGAIVAVEDADDAAGASVVMDVDGQQHRLAVSDVATAKLVPDWDEVFAIAKSAGDLATGTLARGKQGSK
jgi:ribosome maturation factor RimP